MWKLLQDSPPFFLYFVKKCRYHILVTDFIKIWEVYFNEDDFLKCLKDSNFCLEMNANELIEKGVDMLLNPKELKIVKITHDGSIMAVTMTKNYGFPLHFKIKLIEGSPELFYQKVTQPLLKTVKDLRCSEHELRKGLLKKDEEIEEYKSLGSKLRYTALPPFSDEVHMQKHCSYESNFGSMEIPDVIFERTINIPREDEMNINIDSTITIKQEPLSQENVSNQQQTGVAQIKQEIKTESKPIIPIRPKRKKALNL